MSNDQQQPKQSFLRRELSSRGFGIGMLLIGSVIGYVGVISPLEAASHHDATVRVSLKAIGITPLLFATGLVYALFPAKATALLGHPQQPSRLGWLFAAAFLVLGITLYFWLESLLRAYGYDV
ncbi:MAG: hypothetical protein ACKVP0_25760 [Pirellulaceae bacterium]